MLGKLLAVSMLTIAFAAMPASAIGDDETVDDVTWSCTVDAGVPLIAWSPLPGGPSLGGCTLGLVEASLFDTDETELEVTGLDSPASCSIQADDDDDRRADRVLGLGDTVSQAARIIAFCDVGVDLDNSITLSDLPKNA